MMKKKKKKNKKIKEGERKKATSSDISVPCYHVCSSRFCFTQNFPKATEC
jgi:hypothetical protein